MRKSILAVVGFMTWVVVCGTLAPAWAAVPAATEGLATLIVKIGPVYIVRHAQEEKDKIQAQKGDLLYAGDKVKVGELARAALLLNDGSVIRLKENTELALAEKKPEKEMHRLKLILGQLWAKIKKQDSGLEIETPSAVAAVKGTELELTALANGQTDLVVWDGMVSFFNDLGQVLVYASQQSSAARGGKPSPPKAVNLQQQDQWFESVVDVPESKVLKLEIKDKEGKDHSLNLKYQKR